ncbi:pyridoxal-phosphate dependent enzyme [Fontimonas sp. SYSU GA230001]|uniref:1-aminocyclopropane-1-carboxylate deaminase/D-cysteine desulfhydrase n=1 Tax=Fontimonas sp. SYSU GA230001 TaxID=3142450 RepID=UPI0032B5137E
MSSYPLFDAFPRLGVFPRAGLLHGATPVQPLRGYDTVWIKRDDLSASDYGGNKIRKLDLLLARAAADDRRDLVTFGYSGSNFVAATAWHGRKLSLTTHAFLLPQADAPYVADNLATGLHCGAELRVGRSQPAVVAQALACSLRVLARSGRAPRWIPPGGSTPLGALGFVNAAFELRQQIDAGELPVPQRLYVAFSSMGTVAGLAIGLALAGLPTRIEAIQVVGPQFASRDKLDRLVQRTLALLRRTDPAAAPARIAEVDIRTEFFGEHYAVATDATKGAMQRFAAATGAHSDSAYSGKALAGLHADLDAGTVHEPVLYWHTFNAHGRPAGVAPLSKEALRDYVLGG